MNKLFGRLKSLLAEFIQTNKEESIESHWNPLLTIIFKLNVSNYGVDSVVGAIIKNDSVKLMVVMTVTKLWQIFLNCKISC